MEALLADRVRGAAMKYRQLDSSGDYVMKNSQAFLTGTDAVVQAITTNLKLLKSEWWESLSEGLPLFQSILGQPGTPDNIKATNLIIQERILGTQGVTKITSFASTYVNRQYAITQCVVDTIYGTVTVEGVTL